MASVLVSLILFACYISLTGWTLQQRRDEVSYGQPSSIVLVFFWLFFSGFFLSVGIIDVAKWMTGG
jgi:hypothetical protein